MSRREKREAEENAKKGKKSVLKIIFILLLLIIIIGGISIFAWYELSLKPVEEGNSQSIIIDIVPGQGTEGIASALKENNLIKDDLVFKIYCKLNEVNNMQAGTYELNKNMSVEEIVKQFQAGDVVIKEINVTFQEGKNMRDIAKIISENTNNSYEDVMKVFEDKEYAKGLIEEYWFLTDEILDNNIYYPLEGYLYPDTYTFESVDVSINDIIKIMLDQTDKVLSEYQIEIKSKGYTVHQFLSLASVVENEGISTEDRKGITKVFLNRIERGMALQSDVTTYYAFKVNMGDRDLTQSELNTANPYNTRGPNMEGKIPVGPISNVSESAIEATLNPSDTDAIFFVADKNGKIYFSNTNEEHEQIINELKSQGLWHTY